MTHIEQATEYLKNRYQSRADENSMLRNQVTEQDYVAANLNHVIRHPLVFCDCCEQMVPRWHSCNYNNTI